MRIGSIKAVPPSKNKTQTKHVKLFDKLIKNELSYLVHHLRQLELLVVTETSNLVHGLMAKSQFSPLPPYYHQGALLLLAATDRVPLTVALILQP